MFSISSKFHPWGAAWRCRLHPCQRGGECYTNNLRHDREVPRLHSLLHHVPKPLPDKQASLQEEPWDGPFPAKPSRTTPTGWPTCPTSLKVRSSSCEAPAWTPDSEFIKSEISHLEWINLVLGNPLVSTVKQDTSVVILTSIIRVSMKVKPHCSTALNT